MDRSQAHNGPLMGIVLLISIFIYEDCDYAINNTH